MKTVKLESGKLQKLHTSNPRLASFNVEMAEVTGGTFWKAYTPEQIVGTEEFYVDQNASGLASRMGDFMQVYPPIDLYDEKLRCLTKALGPAWIRVSGTWATKTYYDFDGTTRGTPPEGYLNVLTRDQWIGVLNFVKAVDGKLLVSVSNCPGLHCAEESWHPAQAEELFAFSQAYGVPISAAEFANEPNAMEETGFPAGYTPAHYRRDQDLFFSWLQNNYPDCIKVGPSSTGGDGTVMGRAGDMRKLIPELCDCAELMEGTQVPLDVFSYHCYNGVSERIASVMPEGHWSAEEAVSEPYLNVFADFCRIYQCLRDQYVPGGELWVTESGDAAGGGNTWASTYLDVIRTLNELGGFSAMTKGVIFHNTLASSDYGLLARQGFDPRPNYFAVLLWNRVMGNTVFDCGDPAEEGAHVYCHSRKDGKPGAAYLVINNSLTESTKVELPGEAACYILSGENLRSSVMRLNGRELTLTASGELPDLFPERQKAGSVELAPCTCGFFVF